MHRLLLILLKALCAFAIFVAVALLTPATDHALHAGTVFLLLVAAALVAFAGSGLTRGIAGGYLALALAIIHGVDWYFWVGVWDHGLPWPYASPPSGVFIGSVGVFIYQVSVASLALLSGLALPAVAIHRWYRRKHTRSAAMRAHVTSTQRSGDA